MPQRHEARSPPQRWRRPITKPHGRGEAAQRHEVEALTMNLRAMNVIATVAGITSAAMIELPQSWRNRIRIIMASASPEKNRIAHARNRSLYQVGLVVKRRDLHTARQRFLEAFDLGVDRVGDLDRVAFGLAIDVNQNRRLAFAVTMVYHGLTEREARSQHRRIRMGAPFRRGLRSRCCQSGPACGPGR